MPAMARALLIGLMLLVTTSSHGAYIVEPTMQPVIRPLMAVPKGAPKGVEPAGASLQRDHVVVRFRLPEGEAVTFSLHHPKVAQPGDLSAGPFTLRSSLPAEHRLTRAFITACEGLEGRFHWGLAGSAGAPSPLEVARARLVMQDGAGLTEAVDEALTSAP